jgi:PKD repeat protein
MRIAIALALVLGVAGCDRDETCVWHDLSVSLGASVEQGTTPLTVDFTAHGEGFYCGCCGGKSPTQIRQFRWDLDGDGAIDRSGADLTKLSRIFDRVGVYTVRVTVVDSDGHEASAQQILRVAAP